MPMIAMEKEIPMIEEINIPTNREIEADGFITPPSALEARIMKEVLGEVQIATAAPMTDCIYPLCEDCHYYHAHYCTVPIVFSKQIYRLLEEKLAMMEKRLTVVENLVTEEILGV